MATYSQAATDVVDGVKFWRLWTAIAWTQIQQRYKRTWLGVSWIALSFMLFSGVKIFIFGGLSDHSTEYFAVYLTTGYLVFRLISTFVTQGASVFVASHNWIKSEPLPLSVHIFSLLANNYITFAVAAVPTLVVCFLYGNISLLILLNALACLLIYAINGVWVSAMIGVISTRHRDILHFISTLMQMTYFITPILWVAPETGVRAIAANWNPITHFIEIFRQPFCDGTFPLTSWIVVGTITLIGSAISFGVFANARKQLIYWL